MVESRPLEKALSHVTLIVGIAIITFPIFIALVASSHEAEGVMTTVRGWFGGVLLENYATFLNSGKGSAVGVPVALMMGNSFVMSMGIVISILSAYAIVYFRFPLREFFFWILFMTLMLAVKVRILPSQFVKGLIETEK